MDKSWYLVTFWANMNDSDKAAMNKCFFDAMNESMGIDECSGLEITPDDGKITKVMLYYDNVVDAERCLIDNGIDKDEAAIVLQALGYILLNAELYPETK